MNSAESENEIDHPTNQEGENPTSPAESTESHAQILTPEEARVLGALLEKAQTTPDYYPLTMNALVAACNQKSNRTPVVDYDEQTVEEAIAGLRNKGFALRVTAAGSRVTKYQHSLERALPELGEPKMALLTVLLLRGQQTLGELRTRTERMYHFDTLEETQEALDEMEIYPPRQLVKSIEAGGGRRVKTFVHLLCTDDPDAVSLTQPAEPAHPAPAAPDWHENMEQEVAALREEVARLKQEFDEFRAQFG